MPYQLPVSVDVYMKVTTFLAGTIPIIGAGEQMALDFDSRRCGLMVHVTSPANTDFVAYSEKQGITAANSNRFDLSPALIIFDFPPRNQMWIAAATAAAEIRITEFLMQHYRQSIGQGGSSTRIRANVQHVT
jgi:hypothetical protein